MAMASGCSEARFAQNLLEELGMPARLHLSTDSTSAIDLAFRHGVGRVRHLGVRQTWLQEELRAERITIGYVPAATNVADLFTKVLTKPVFERWRALIGIRQIKDLDGLVGVIYNVPNFLPPRCLEHGLVGGRPMTEHHWARPG